MADAARLVLGNIVSRWRRRVALVLLFGSLFAGLQPAIAAEAAPLVVATREVPPFAMHAEGGGWDGIAIELWTSVAERLGRPFQLHEMGLQEMLAAVEQGKVDAAVAALTITSQREAALDFSHPFHTSGLGIAVQQRPGGGWLAAIKRVFSEQFAAVTASLFGLLAAVGVLVWLAERRRNPQFQAGPLKGIGSGLWWSAVTMTTVGYGDKAPVSLPGRLIAMIWMFASVIIISGFTAAIATALTVDKLEQGITGVNDLYKIRVATLPGSTSETFLTQRLIHHRTLDSLPEALEALGDGQVDAIVYDAPILRYLVAENYPNRLSVLPQVLQRQDYGFAFPTGSPLREGVNRALLEIIRSPEWERLLERYLGPES
jgi:polar amino acid transport system substrate-binding protein